MWWSPFLGALTPQSQTQATIFETDGEASSGFKRLITKNELQMLPWKLLIWQKLQFMELFNCMKNGTRQHRPGSVSVLPRALSRGSLQCSRWSSPAGLQLPDLGRCSESQALSLSDTGLSLALTSRFLSC